jgi:hypothetical protein
MVELIVCALALGLMAGAHVRLARKYDSLLHGITERTEARDRALQKQAKVNERRVAQTDRQAAKTLDAAKAALDAARALREDALVAERRVHGVLDDPRLQRFLTREGGE